MTNLIELASTCFRTFIDGLELLGNIVGFVLRVNYIVVVSTIEGIVSIAAAAKKSVCTFAFACVDTVDSAFRLCQDVINLLTDFVNFVVSFAQSCISLAELICCCIWNAGVVVWNATHRICLAGNSHFSVVYETIESGSSLLVNTFLRACGHAYEYAAFLSDAARRNAYATLTAAILCLRQCMYYVLNYASALTDAAFQKVVAAIEVCEIGASRLFANLSRTSVGLCESVYASVSHVYTVVLPGIPLDVYATVAILLLVVVLHRCASEHLEARGFSFPSLNVFTRTDARHAQTHRVADEVTESDRDNSDEDDEFTQQQTRHETCPVLNPSEMSQSELTRALEQEQDRQLCVICRCEPKSVLLLPCRHMCLCGVCARHISRSTHYNQRICPLCRSQLEAVMNVYV
ncbi:uncharacterized protein LOC141908670 [Tubulanus polymorphus]|uniref:uncharacterized protein LOC141908670 n=1 Tax=Tubulanus polymorphus TaxID=672921 RepID=UPI003DA4680C